MRTHSWQPASLSERAYTRIREKILKGEYPLGAAISRRQLAVEFGVSFLPVSDAVKRLEQEGLVESRPRVGTRVRVPTPEDLRDRCIIREALETQSARLFAEHAGADQRLEMRAMAMKVDALMDDTSRNGDRDRVYQAQMAHLSFHMRLAECAGSALLCEMLAKNQVLILNWLYDLASGHHVPPHWHQKLMDRVAGTDPEQAERAMREHVHHGFDDIQQDISARFGGDLGPITRVKRRKALR